MINLCCTHLAIIPVEEYLANAVSKDGDELITFSRSESKFLTFI